MKILIALDIGEYRPIKDDNTIIDGAYSQEYKDLTYADLLGLNGPGLKHGEIISFNEYHLTKDSEKDSFYKAEFHGILET